MAEYPPSHGAIDPATVAERFGPYVLVERIASGGMAELFLARTAEGELIVVKRVLPSVQADSAFIDRLLEEGRIGATLSHPNLVRVLDAGIALDRAFIAMEYVDGEDLRSILRELGRTHPEREGLRVPLEHAITVVLGVGRGLAHAQAKGLIHCDVSPPNVMVGFDGSVKLVDFGLARTVDTTTHSSATAAGTASYMSPEQARGERLDGRSDVFSLGIILFELTTSLRLFKGKTDYETLRLISDRDAPRPSAVRPDYPLDLEPIVMRALARSIDDRYASVRSMLVDLEAYVRGISDGPNSLAEFMRALFSTKLADATRTYRSPP